jgi:hypothetical protein
MGQEAAGFRSDVLDRRDEFVEVNDGAAQVVDDRAGGVRERRLDERVGDIGRVLQVDPASERDVVRDAERSRLHGVSRRRGQSLIATGPEDSPRSQPDGRKSVVVPEDPGRLLIRDP